MTKEIGNHTILERYQNNARQYAAAIRVGDHVAANAHHKTLETIYRQLQKKKEAKLLRTLLTSPDVGIRVWAAAHCLQCDPEQAANVLKDIANGPPDPMRFMAEVTLANWMETEKS